MSVTNSDWIKHPTWQEGQPQPTIADGWLGVRLNDCGGYDVLPKPVKQASGFAIRNLSVLAYANGFTLWHYKSSKCRLDTIAADDYFADAADMLTQGDLIVTTGTDGGRMLLVTHVNQDHVHTGRLA